MNRLINSFFIFYFYLINYFYLWKLINSFIILSNLYHFYYVKKIDSFGFNKSC